MNTAHPFRIPLGRFVKRLLLALLIGCSVSFLPVAALNLPLDSSLSHLYKNAADALLFPGYVVALAVSLGRFHDVRFGFVVLANVAVYSGFAYFVLAVLVSLRAKFGAPRHSGNGPTIP